MKTSQRKVIGFALLLFLFAVPKLHADSATWLQNPADSNWNNPANWTAGGPPNGSSDQATFGTSNQTAISLSTPTEVGSVFFSAGANAFVITIGSNRTLTLSGTGILNSSGISQNFITDAFGSPVILFKNSATAGTSNSFFNNGGTDDGLAGGATRFYDSSTAGTSSFSNYGGLGGTLAFGGFTQFFGTSSAGSATFVSHGGAGPPSFTPMGGATQFFDGSSASHGTFIAAAGESDFANGGSTQFFDNSTASDAVLSIDGGTFTPHVHGGVTEFHDSSTAANATLVCSASRSEGYAATIKFFDNATAGNSSITLEAAQEDFSSGGLLEFHGNSTAANATIVNNGIPIADGLAGVGITSFYDTATAGNATLIANGQGSGGAIFFNSTASRVCTARIEVLAKGYMFSVQPSLTVGSIEGDGFISLSGNLTVGSNNFSTLFSGVIQGSAASSLSKVGTGTLTLGNANTYAGPTTISSGKLQASHDSALGYGDLSLINSGAKLSLQDGATNNYIFDQAIVSVVSGSTINLNYKGTPDVVGFLIVDGVSQPAGIYGGPASGAPHQFPQFTGAGTILVTTPVAVSRKLQGATNFDMNLPFAGASEVECRNAGANNAYQIVATFGFPITFNSASVTSGTANIANVTGNGTPMVTINLTGVTNRRNSA